MSSRRSSLTPGGLSSPVPPLNAAGRRPSIAGATPNLATGPEASKNRRGSLKDLAAAREAAARAVFAHDHANDNSSHASKAASAFSRFLQQYSVKDLSRSVPTIGNIIDIDGTLKPLEGFEILLKNNIEAAPVYTITVDQHGIKSKDYTGFLDVRDLVSSVIFVQTQPINEDDLVYTANGPEVSVSFVRCVVSSDAAWW
jgi:hypothetical protein